MRALLPLFLCLAQILPAQEPLCLVKRFGVEDGLLNRRVTAITQDREGFLWIGTPGGLHRFDGYTFKTFTTIDGLSSNAVDAIWTDAEGLLWVVRGGTASDLQAVSIDIVDPRTDSITSFEGHFGNKAPLRDNELLPECSVTADTTLVLSAPGRTIRYHPRTGFTVAHLGSDLDFIPYVTTADGASWGTSVLRPRSDQLTHWDGGTPRRDPAVAGKNIFWSLVGNASQCGDPFEKNGRYLCVEKPDGRTEEWWMAPSGAHTLVRTGDMTEAWWCRLRMPLGDDLWLVGATVRRMEPGGDPLAAPVLIDLAQHYPDILFHQYTAYRDRTGHLWIGGDFGLYRAEVRANPFQRLLWAASIPRGHGRRIRGMALLDSTLFVNSELEGHWRIDPNTGSILEADTTTLNRYALAPDGAGGLWSAEGDSLIHWNANGGRAGHGIDIAHMFVWSVLPLKDGALLLGTGSGLCRADPVTHRASPIVMGQDTLLQGAVVVDLARDRTGTIWISSSAGLFNAGESGHVTTRWWNGARAARDSAHYLPAIDLRHFRQDADGIIWLATGDAGLVRWDRATGDVRTIGREAGLASNSVYASYADDLGQLWVPTDNGITRYDPASGSVTNYSTTDGITHNEFNRLAHTQGPDGRLYFGGLNGITAFDPRTLRNKHPGNGAPLVITDVRQCMAGTDRVVDLTAAVRKGATITMEPGDRYFTVNMALLSFEDPTRINYAWRIDGVDMDWNYQHEPSLRIAALPYGEHLLRIKAQGGNGTWTNELQLPLLFARPLYLRWWFITPCSIIVLTIMFWNVRARYITARTAALEQGS